MSMWVAMGSSGDIHCTTAADNFLRGVRGVIEARGNGRERQPAVTDCKISGLGVSC